MSTGDNAVATLSRRRLVQSTVVAGAALGSGSEASAKRAPGAADRFGTPLRQESRRLAFALSADDLVSVQPHLDEYSKADGVMIETHAFPYASLYENLSINLTQATGAYDVASMDDPWMPLFAGAGFLVDLAELMASKGVAPDSDFVPELLALGDFPPGSGLRGIPWIGNVQVFAYRTDVLQELGLTVPATWDDVLSNAQAITGAKSSEDMYGIGLRGKSANDATTGFIPILRGYGGDIFESNEVFEPRLESEQAMQAIATFLALAKLAPPGVESVDHEANSRNMYTGRTAQSGDIWPDQVLQMFDPSLSAVIGKIAIGPEPASPGVAAATMTGNQLLGIPMGSKNHDQALEFIMWLTAREQQKRLLLNANVPATRISVLEDPEAVEKLPFLPGMLAAARNATPRPRTVYYPAVELVLGGYLAEALAGRISGADALAGANQEIRALMVREGVLQG